MSKPKQPLEFQPDGRLLDERGPTTERMRGADFDVGDTGTITLRQSPVERAVRRGTLTQRQGKAAEEFYRHWYQAGLAGSTGSADPLKVFGTGSDFSKLFASERAEAHAWAIRKVIRAIRERQGTAGHRGDHGVQILWLIVCQEVPFREAGESLKDAQGLKFLRGTSAEVMARTILRSALNILIDEWGL
jgi:hypothetical protein